MKYPILEHKGSESVINLSANKNEIVNSINIFNVKLAVMLFDPDLDDIMGKKGIKGNGGFRSGVDFHPYYIWNNILIVNSFLGGPNAAGLMEELSALGVKCFLAISGAGSISDEFCDDYLVALSAIRDEGTSYHYLSPAPFVVLDEKLIELLTDFLKERNIGYIMGRVWTTDSYYTENEELIENRIKQNAKAVDMECATWAAVAKAKGLSFCELLYCTDIHKGSTWKKLENRNIKRRKATLFALDFAEVIVKRI